MASKRQDLVAPLAERLNREPHDIQAEIQVLPETAFADHGGQVAMRGGDDSQIDGDRLDAADRHDGALLNAAQQFGLNGQRQLADFIEKQRAAIGTANEAQSGRDGAGERALHVAEQLRFHQLGREDRAIDRHKRCRRTRTESMNLPGGDFFAGAGFAFDQERWRSAERSVRSALKSRGIIGCGGRAR